MKGWLLDTNVVAEIVRPKPDRKVQSWIVAQPENTLFISILTLAEYQKGLHNLVPGGPILPRLQALVVRIETRFASRILPVSNAIALRLGAISGEVKRLTKHSPPGHRHSARRHRH